MNRPAAGVGESSVDGLDLDALEGRGDVETFRSMRDRFPEPRPRWAAKFRLFGKRPCNDVPMSVDDNADPVLRGARLLEDGTDGIRHERYGQDISQDCVADHRGPDG